MSVVKMELPSPFPRVEQKASLNPERIRCARETTGLSKVQLAESLGVTSRVFCQVGVGRFGVSFSPCERRVSGRFGVGRSCWLLVIALVIA